MPCYTIQSVSAVLKIADMDLLEKAIRSLFSGVDRNSNTITFDYGRQSFNKATGELRVRDQKTVSIIKQAYGAEIVKAQAKKYGWQLKQVSQFKFEVVKR